MGLRECYFQLPVAMTSQCLKYRMRQRSSPNLQIPVRRKLKRLPRIKKRKRWKMTNGARCPRFYAAQSLSNDSLRQRMPLYSREHFALGILSYHIEAFSFRAAAYYFVLHYRRLRRRIFFALSRKEQQMAGIKGQTRSQRFVFCSYFYKRAVLRIIFLRPSLYRGRKCFHYRSVRSALDIPFIQRVEKGIYRWPENIGDNFDALGSHTCPFAEHCASE